MADQADQDQCNGDAVDVGYFGLRIASIFIILVASGVGAFAPVILARQSKIPVPKFAFFVCKYIGTGVIIATAWLHLLDPAVENLSDACLEPMLGDYPWPEAIGLWTVLLMFFFEMLASRSLDNHDSPSTAQKEFELDPAMDVVAKSSAKDSSSAAERGEQDGPLNEPHDHLAHRHSHEEETLTPTSEVSFLTFSFLSSVFSSTASSLV
uniref:Zinc/iron permease n=1 Tax=Bionectria ochroleuca TaxID=29856 RepID=A0A8H7MZR9_BIOOC